MNNITMYPIGIIHSPYKEAKNIPIQGCFKENVEGVCNILDKYSDGLCDLEGFSHAILIYHFHMLMV